MPRCNRALRVSSFDWILFMTAFHPSRRKWLKATAAAGSAAAAAPFIPEPDASAAPAAVAAATASAPAAMNVLLRVNGRDHQMMIDPRTTLLDALRERL